METIAAVERMDRTHLVIQGPPGSGKTFTSAHAIVSLLENGKRVGVTSLSHKAINNLLRTVEEVAAKRGITFTGVKLAKDPEDRLGGAVIQDVSDNKVVSGGDHQLIGGTAWLFSRPEMEKKVDYLFVDEAGQVSLANIVATGLAAEILQANSVCAINKILQKCYSILCNQDFVFNTYNNVTRPPATHIHCASVL
jgi:uncharacterized protein